MSNIHVYAIGGCHLTDYIVGKDKSFLEISMKTIKLDYVIDNIISPATVFSGKNKIKKVYLENYPDTLLIIQLGNYETRRPIFKKPTSNQSSQKNGSFEIKPFNDGLFFRINSIIKLLIILIFELINKPLFDRKIFHRDLVDFFNEVAKIKFGRVVVISSFYCMEPHVNFYRKIVNKFFLELSIKYGFLYVDIFSPVYNLVENRKLMHDAGHLNDKGHAYISYFVVDALRSLVKS